MFVPKINQVSDQQQLVAFMKRFSFATIVSTIDQVPQAAHLPFTIVCRDGVISLHAHFAKANPQWKNIEGQTVLVIFSEPHAYISPTHYDKIESVPTWNYYAVHAYGNCSLVHDPAIAVHHLEAMMLTYEPDYKLQWDGLSDSYKNKMLNGILSFTVTVKNLQANNKMSQNKTSAEQERIINTLSKSKDSAEQMTAEYMLSNLKNK